MSSNDEDSQELDKSYESAHKKMKFVESEEVTDLLATQDYSIIGRASGGAEKALAGGIPHDIDSLDLVDEVQEEEMSDDDTEDDDSLYDSEVPEEEIDALLEEGLPEEMKGPRSQRKKPNEESSSKDPEDVPYEKKEKVMLVEKGVNHFEVLPEGWVEITHNSGMSVYLHKESRVCTFSRPYFLGSGSVRKHSVPISAIPCLKYLRDLEESEKEKLEKEKREMEKINEENTKEANGTEDGTNGIMEGDNSNKIGEATCPFSTATPGPLAKALVAQAVIPPQKVVHELNQAVADTRVESVNEAQKEYSLEAEQLREYCQKRFQFKTIKLLRFKTWGDKRRYEKVAKWRNRPQLPEGTKLISLKRHNAEDGSVSTSKKEWVINPKGKSYVCILHEYVQHILKNQPKYEFKEVENAATPYAASISINDVHYSTGYGSSKKIAKVEAAKSTLEILLPELGKKIRMEKKNEEETDLSFFDEIRVEDPRVPELCNKTSELSPYSILLNCLQRNFGLSGANIECRLVTEKNQKNEFVMSVGKHTVQVSCRNKKDGKQRASQSILQKLHPHITSWGSLLRLYGNRSLQTMRERKAEEQEVTLLQTNATLHQPNTSIINKLKEEMLKLKYMKSTVQPIGKFFPPENICPPSTYGTELNNVDL